jgi:hypothetical protein
MLHFASDFLAQQLVCCVHVFGCRYRLYWATLAVAQ